MWWHLVRSLLAIVLLLGVGSDGAQAQGRALTPEAAAQFRAIGRLNIAGSRFCTATLIGPSHVLTAAHCLYDPRTHVRIPDTAMSFQAGLNGGYHAAHRRITHAAILPDYRFDGVVSHERVRTDIAVLELDRPIAAHEATPMPLAASAAPGVALSLVSYSRGRPGMPSLQGDGAVLARQGSVAAMSFNVTHGASGSPVLAMSAGSLRVVGIVSASATRQGRAVALAVMTGDTVARLAAQLPGETRLARLQPGGS